MDKAIDDCIEPNKRAFDRILNRVSEKQGINNFRFAWCKLKGSKDVRARINGIVIAHQKRVNGEDSSLLGAVVAYGMEKEISDLTGMYMVFHEVAGFDDNLCRLTEDNDGEREYEPVSLNLGFRGDNTRAAVDLDFAVCDRDFSLFTDDQSSSFSGWDQNLSVVLTSI